MQAPAGALSSSPDGATRQSAARRATLIWSAAAAAFVFVVLQSSQFVYDDAYISFRYAESLVRAGELAWNPGERVEGYTNFLYVLLLSLFLDFGADPVAAARAINISSVGLLLFAYHRAAIGLIPGTERAEARAMGGLLLAGTVAVPFWTMGALEAPMAAALVMLAVWMMASEGGGAARIGMAGLFAALAYLTRMDAVVPIVAVLAGAVALSAGRLGSGPRAAAAILAILAACVALHLAWRFSYYGELVPNTYFAKVGVPLSYRLEFGVSYLGRSLLEAPLVLVSVALAGTVLFRRANIFPGRHWLAACTLAVVAQLGYVLWAGGDHLPVGRFLVPALGPAALALALAFAAFGETSRSWISAAAGVLVLATVALVPGRHPFHGGAEAGRLVGAYINRAVPEDAVIALNVAGATPWVARRHRFIDMLGLNDARIARRENFPMRTAWQRRPGHAKGDGAYVLSRRPDIIIIGGAIGAEIDDALFLGELELAELPEFRRCYSLERVQIDGRHSRWARFAGYGDVVPFTFYRRIC